MDPELEKKLQHLPTRPGVYLFKDRRGDILYIGKARSLRSRVRNHFGVDPTSVKNAEMVRRVLGGEPGGRRDAVLLNAGAALVAAELAGDIGEGVEVAAAAIDSGAALATLERLVAFSSEVRA